MNKQIMLNCFDEARKIYPGLKRRNETEFENFRKKHKDWKERLPLLKPAIEAQIKWRISKKKRNEFIPEWKHFRTWINQRWWEVESMNIEEEQQKLARQREIEQERKEQIHIREDYQCYLEEKTTQALLDIKNDGGQLANVAGWLIDEILEKRKHVK